MISAQPNMIIKRLTYDHLGQCIRNDLDESPQPLDLSVSAKQEYDWRSHQGLTDEGTPNQHYLEEGKTRPVDEAKARQLNETEARQLGLSCYTRP